MITAHTIGLILIVSYLTWMLYRTIRRDEQNMQKNGKLRLISKATGKIFDVQLVTNDQMDKEALNDDSFLVVAKIVFTRVLDSFTNNKINELKGFLSENVFRVFEQSIRERLDKKQTLDFSLICLSSAKILNKEPDYKTVTVEFVTEQVNVLKNADGQVIEGDPLHVARMNDIWTFEKRGKFNWVVSATKSEIYAN